MQVILQERVAKLGQPWDVVEVKPGFARNFLFPRSLAIPATKSAMAKVEEMKAKVVAQAEAVIENAKEVSESLKDTVLTFTKKARGEKLYGALKENDIIEAIKADKKIELKASMLEIAEPIKTLGKHNIKINLTDDINVDITINVEQEA